MSYFGLTSNWLTFWVTVACATDMTLFGYDQGVFGGVIVTDSFLDLMGIAGSSTTQSTVTAIYDVGCFLGAVATIWLGEPLGRKKTVLLGTTIMSIGAILQTTAYGLPQMFVGRVIGGIGNGINTSIAPVWQGETSKASWRGKLIVIEMIMNIFGFSMSNWVTYGFSYASGSVSWRLPLALQFIFIAILYLTVPWLPESPRWLIAKGRIQEADRILADLEGVDVDDAYVVAESRDIQWAVEYERENTVPWSDLLRGRTGDAGGTCTIRRMLLGMGAQAMQQFAGINVTSYYLSYLLIHSVGMTEKMSRLLTACNSVSYLLFSFIGIPNVERWGRRKMMMICAFGQFACYLVITICIRYTEASFIAEGTQRQFAKASVAFFFLYYVFFGIGWQGVPWLYPTEINSLSMRTKGASLATATNWIVNFLVVEITPPGISSLGWKFYIIWTVFNLTFVPIVYFLYPETAKRTLEDVDRFFRESQGILVHRDPDAVSTHRPLKYIQHEEEQIRQGAAAHAQDATALRRRAEREKQGKPDADEEKAYSEELEPRVSYSA